MHPQAKASAQIKSCFHHYSHSARTWKGGSPLLLKPPPERGERPASRGPSCARSESADALRTRSVDVAKRPPRQLHMFTRVYM